MKALSAIIGSFFLIALGAFCVFGVLATFEPTNNPKLFLAFRIGYTVVGLGCIAGIFLLIVNAVREKRL
jgi:hypothetical protein